MRKFCRIILETLLHIFRSHTKTYSNVSESKLIEMNENLSLPTKKYELMKYEQDIHLSKEMATSVNTEAATDKFAMKLFIVQYLKLRLIL
jgi:hypothetical protein